MTQFCKTNAQRFALPALGRGRRSRPARKMKRRRKLLGMCADSPASGARFVGTLLTFEDSLPLNIMLECCVIFCWLLEEDVKPH